MIPNDIFLKFAIFLPFFFKVSPRSFIDCFPQRTNQTRHYPIQPPKNPSTSNFVYHSPLSSLETLIALPYDYLSALNLHRTVCLNSRPRINCLTSDAYTRARLIPLRTRFTKSNEFLPYTVLRGYLQNARTRALFTEDRSFPSIRG